MKVCPTGALVLVESKMDIHMGAARVELSTCLRGVDASGEDCMLCVTDCPLGDGAIGLDERGNIEVRGGCTGCGVCERVCPTEPASIRVLPTGAG